MSAKRNLIQIVVILGLLLVSACTAQPPATSLPDKPGSVPAAASSKPTSTATPDPLPELDPAVQAGMEKCAAIVPGQVCLVEGPVKVEAQPERSLSYFDRPGEILSLADIQTLKLGEAGSTKGVVVMSIATEWPGVAFTALAFGDVKLNNEVSFGTREYNPMQSLTLATGENKEGQAPTSGFFVASPESENLLTLVVNRAELSFGSGALLTSLQGGLGIQTMWGAIGVWLAERFVAIFEGDHVDLTDEEIEQRLLDETYDPGYETVKRALDRYYGNKNPDGSDKENEQPAPYRDSQYDPSYEIIKRALARYYENEEFWKKYWERQNRPDPMAEHIKKLFDKFIKEEANRKKRKPWKGGWWKMTYGPNASTGQCKGKVVAGGYSGGDGKPYTTEIPICRGNNGNTILMHESGVSYDRVAPNLFNRSNVSMFDLLGNGNLTTEGQFLTLQVLSPTRMVLSNTLAEKNGCTTASVVYLDYLRDDPNIRCGEIIYVRPWDTPQATTPTPAPQQVDPPVEGPYQVRLGTLSNACDPAAKAFAPSFTTAGVSLSPENKLVVDAASTKYELELSNLTFTSFTEKEGSPQDRLGIFTLEQPVNDSFGLMMTLVQMPDQQWSGSWLVSNQDGSQLCGGSIDLLAPE